MLKNGSKKGFLIVKLRFFFLPTAFIVYGILVHCRVGSLEMQKCLVLMGTQVHCRVGSLERTCITQLHTDHVHCRVGGQKSIQTAF